MGVGIIQLVALNVQDAYLTGDPQITYFKMVYRRHTNFAIESVPQHFSSTANFGETVTCSISRLGDLISRTYLYVEVPAILVPCNKPGKKFAWVRNLGHALVQEVSIEIDGKVIDKQYGEWMHIWSELTSHHDEPLNKILGNIPNMYEFSAEKPAYNLYIPLEFWFCRNNGLSLPLVALSSSDVKFTITFRKLEECYRIGPTHSIEISEDIVPFEPGDYIEQTINEQTIYGYVINYDYLTKKLGYIKIQCPSANKTMFESHQDDANPFNMETDVLFTQFSPGNSAPGRESTPDLQKIPDNNDQHVPYRIYHSLTRHYCTPRPNTRELFEQDALIKPHFVKSFLYVDYVYLDTTERNKFINTSHEYLIEQIQFNQEINVKSSNIKQNLTLNHPCKAHYWVVQLDSLVGPGTINDLFNYTTSHIRIPVNSDKTKFYGTNIVEKSNLLLNGISRFGERDNIFTNLLQAYSHHHRGPSIGINMYFPSIYPENFQPSSTINMSKIDNTSMMMRLKNIGPQNTAKIRSYTINYNILRILLGMGGLVF